MTATERQRRKAVFLDRDGVINLDRHFVHRIDDFEFVPGTPQALLSLQQAGWLLVVVTNQSGIARGLYTESTYQQLTLHMRQSLRSAGVELAAVMHCPHLPDAEVAAYRLDCECRKPGPGMLQAAAAQWAIDLAASVMVGDRHSDIQAGRAAGVGRCILVQSGHLADHAAQADADGVFRNLAHWVDSLNLESSAG